jgi:hypothetical protein
MVGGGNIPSVQNTHGASLAGRVIFKSPLDAILGAVALSPVDL